MTAKPVQNGIVPTPSTPQQAVQYRKDQFLVWQAIVKDFSPKVD